MLFLNYLCKINFDVPTPWGIYFQDSATPQMEGLVELHDNIMYYLVIILFSVAWVMLSIIRNYIETKSPINSESGLGKSMSWVYTLPNFGEALKLLIPYCNREVVYGWSNYSGMVTSQEICESKMGDRESKSVLCNSSVVKDQRVYGGGLVLYYGTCLRCTLMGFERNYEIYNHSKLMSNKLFSTSTIDTDHNELMSKMDPWFFTGFSDGEASFILYIQQTNNTKIGWASWVAFEINLSGKDFSILKSIKSYLGVGGINQKSDGTCVYYVRQFQDISILIDHFDKYPLITQKFADYLLFKSAFEIIKKKEHLTLEGFHKLLAIRGGMNKGLPEILKDAFTNITPVKRSSVLDSKIPDPNWLAGFTTAEGSFMVRVMDRPNSRTQVLLRFKLTQHPKDEQLMRSLVDYLDCGKIYVSVRSVDFIVTKFSDITNKLVPFFGKYPIQGIKLLNYLDFLKVWQLMKNDLHLTSEGVKLIRKIKAGRNLGRK